MCLKLSFIGMLHLCVHLVVRISLSGTSLDDGLDVLSDLVAPGGLALHGNTRVHEVLESGVGSGLALHEFAASLCSCVEASDGLLSGSHVFVDVGHDLRVVV